VMTETPKMIRGSVGINDMIYRMKSMQMEEKKNMMNPFYKIQKKRKGGLRKMGEKQERDKIEGSKGKHIGLEDVHVLRVKSETVTYY